MCRVYIVYILSSVIVSITTAPMDEKAMKYLHKYDYLSSMEVVDGWAMEKAIKKFQASFGLPQTGQLDQTTKAKMTIPRCGMPQKPHPYRRPRWSSDRITYKLWNGTSRFPKSSLAAVFESAAASWTRDSDLSIAEASTASADLNVYFVENDGYGETLAEAEEPERGNIFLDEAEPLTLQPGVEGEVFAGWVVAHELGHALGLLHSASERSVMFPAYNPNALGPSLADRNNLVAIYGGKAALDKTMACQKTPVDAMFFMDRRHYLVKGRHYWIFDKKGLQEGPFSMSETFPFDKEVEAVDAAFFGGDILFLFEDSVYFKFEPRFFMGRKTIRAGFRRLPSNISAAAYDLKKAEIHFFKGSRYYKFNMRRPRGQRSVVEGGDVAEYWRGIPGDVEAATFLDSKTVLFVKNSRCYFFDVDAGEVGEERDCAEFFMC